MAAPPMAFYNEKATSGGGNTMNVSCVITWKHGPHNVIAWLWWRNVRKSYVTNLELSKTERSGRLLYPLPSLLSIILSSINSSIITIIFNYRDQYVESQDGCCEGEGWHADAQIEAHHVHVYLTLWSWFPPQSMHVSLSPILSLHIQSTFYPTIGTPFSCAV